MTNHKTSVTITMDNNNKLNGHNHNNNNNNNMKNGKKRKGSWDSKVSRLISCTLRELKKEQVHSRGKWKCRWFLKSLRLVRVAGQQGHCFYCCLPRLPDESSGSSRGSWHTHLDCRLACCT